MNPCKQMRSALIEFGGTGLAIIAPMSLPDADFDRFFTEHIVGLPVLVDMGRSASVRQVSDRGVRIGALGEKARLIGLAGRTLLSRDPTRAVAGQPLALPGLIALRRKVLVAGLVAWSLLVGGTVAGACIWWMKS